MGIIHPKKLDRLNERLKFATTRIRAYITREKTRETISTFGFLADLSKKGVGLYIDRKISLEEIVLVAFDHPENPPFRATVVWSGPVRKKGKVFSKGRTDSKEASWRVGLEFQWSSKDEELRFKNFFTEITERYSSRVPEDSGVQPVLGPDKAPNDDDGGEEAV